MIPGRLFRYRIEQVAGAIPPTVDFGQRIETMREIEETYSGVEGLLAAPEEFIADMRDTEREIYSLGTDFIRAFQEMPDRVDANLAQAWNAFLASWEAFRQETAQGWQERQPTAQWDPLQRGRLFVFAQTQNTRLEDFKAQTRRWRETYQQRTGRAPTAPARTPVQVPSDSIRSPEGAIRSTLAEFKPLLIGGLVVAGGVTLLFLIKAVKPA